MNAQLLELHYHLRDDAHSMDAHIRNRCEAEALACFEHILQQFNIAANIETTVYTEGGLREIWRFLIKPENASAVGAVAAVTTIPISVLALLVAIWAVPSAPDPETEKINKEIAKLTLEEKRESVKQLREGLKRKSQIDAENSASSKDFPRSSTLGLPEEPNTSTRVLLPSSAGSGNIQVPAASNGQIGLEISKEESASIQISELSYFLGLSPYPLIPGVSTEVVRKAVLALHSDTKVATRRSNFFKSLIGYDRVTAVGLRPLGDSIEVRTIETTVERQDFKKFVMLSDKLPAEIIEDAVIEIVAPVLKQGNVKWKGMYQDQAISFAMADNDFKDMVLRRVVSFGSGDSIRAILNIEKKVDGLGEEVITGYAVSVVTAKIDSNGEQPTQAGRRHKFNSKQTNSQKGLFDAPVSDRDEFPSEDWGSW